METTIISAVAALAGVLLGSLLSRSGEYRKWLRTERHRAATELLAAGEAGRRGVYARHGREDTAAVRDEVMAEAARVHIALEAAHLVFPPSVVAAANQYSEITSEFLLRHWTDPTAKVEPSVAYYEARRALTAAVGRLVAPGSGVGPMLPLGTPPAASQQRNID